MAGLNVPSAPSAPAPLSSKSQQEMTEKLKSLKRRFEELDEECGSDLNRSDERNVRMREEQNHIRAEIKEIESKIQSVSKIPATTSKSMKVKQDAVSSRPQGEIGSRHNIDTPTKTVRARPSLVPSNHPRTRSSGGDVQTMANDLPLVNGDMTQNSPRSSRRVAPRKSQRQVSGANPSIAAVAAAAAAHAEAIPTTSSPQLTSPTQPDVPMMDGTTEPALTTTDSPASTRASPSLSTVYADFCHAPSMESIVRVAEAAVAAQNAAVSHQEASVDPNLDPSLIAESSSASTSSSKTSSNRPPSVDTTSEDTKTSEGASSAAPSSASSNLSNNPYLTLATSYQRGGGTSPTGHPMFYPYPVFYPSPTTPVTPASPTYTVPYSPYYYIPPSLVSPTSGVLSSPQSFSPSQPQASSSSAPQPIQNTSPQVESLKVVKPKRLKAHTVTTKSFSIPMVPRDKKGKPMLPLNVGIMTVISLGTVCMRDHFHTERYIFPVGYEVTRRYLSTIDPSVEVVYHCTILDGGDGPKFQIIPSDRPDKPVIAGTATGAWSSIVKQANAIRNRQHSNSVSGPDFFGLGQNTIKHLIQELPNSDKLKDYVWQNFVEGGPLGGRHAAVIPALPEEYDASLPIGAYYPRRDEAAESELPRGLSYYPQHIIAQAEAQRVTRTVQSQSQLDSLAGASGAAPDSSSSGSEPRLQMQTTTLSTTVDAGSSSLLIHEYRPAQPPSQDSQSSTQKRVTRSSAAASNPSASTSGSTKASATTNTRQSKSASKAQQNQKQSQQQLTQLPIACPPAVNGDGGTPMTFAGIMKAYSGSHLTLSSSSQSSTGATES